MTLGRDAWFDNARWLAGTLVVLVHVFGRYREEIFAVEWLWFGTWSFRIPLFAILVGYFSSPTPSRRDYKHLVSRIVVPLVLLTSAHIAITFLSGEQVSDLWEPQYTLWFLFAIVVWRLVLPLLISIRWPLVISAVLSLIVGLGAFDGDPFGLQRMAANLPFVVFGWWLQNNSSWLRERSPLKTVGALASVAALLLGAFLLTAQGELQASAFAGTAQIANLDGLIQRLAILLIGVIGACSALYLMPRGRVALLSEIGSNGYQIYLLHGLVLALLSSLIDWPSASDLRSLGLFALLLFGLALAAILGSKPVREFLDAVLRSFSWINRPMAKG